MVIGFVAVDLPGRRRRLVGIRIAGMSSNRASNMVASLALAALRISDSGSRPEDGRRKRPTVGPFLRKRRGTVTRKRLAD